MSAFGRFCWKSRRWKSVKFYTCFDASVLERREGPHSPHPTYSMTLTLALRHVCSIVGTSFPRGAIFAVGGNRAFSTESANIFITIASAILAGDVLFQSRHQLCSSLQTKRLEHAPRAVDTSLIAIEVLWSCVHVCFRELLLQYSPWTT